MADKFGRLNVVKTVMILYAIANLMNAFCESLDTFANIKYLTGFSMSGQAIVFVLFNENFTEKNRLKLSLSIISISMGTVGISYLFLQNIISDNWPMFYFVLSIAGILIFCICFILKDTKIFSKIEDVNLKIKKGNIIRFLQNFKQVKKALTGMFLSTPLWFMVTQYIRANRYYRKIK